MKRKIHAELDEQYRDILDASREASAPHQLLDNAANDTVALGYLLQHSQLPDNMFMHQGVRHVGLLCQGDEALLRLHILLYQSNTATQSLIGNARVMIDQCNN